MRRLHLLKTHWHCYSAWYLFVCDYSCGLLLLILMWLWEATSDPFNNHILPEEDAVSLFSHSVFWTLCMWALGTHPTVMDGNEAFKSINPIQRSSASVSWTQLPFTALRNLEMPRDLEQHEISGPNQHVEYAHFFLLAKYSTIINHQLYGLWGHSPCNIISPSTTTAILQFKLRSVLPAVRSYITLLS